MYRLSPAGKENEEATRRPTDASAAVEDAAKKVPSREHCVCACATHARCLALRPLKLKVV
jgi:hypothetical protein